MTTNRNPRLPDLLAFLEASERQDQELRAVIASELTSPADRMQALLELAQLSSDLTTLVLEVIKSEERDGFAPRY